MHGRQLIHGGTLRGVRIRTKDSGDTAACVRLVTEIHCTDGYPQPLPADPAAFVTPSYETVAWVAESDGRIIGHVALHHPALDPTLQVAQRVTGLSANRLALVARLLVDPTRRRLGVGRHLLAVATGHAASLGQRAVLDVFRDAGAPIALYEAAGWIRVDALTLAADDGTSLQLWVYLAPTDGHR
jgi:GNAT superfamily N-acetyltransferase